MKPGASGKPANYHDTVTGGVQGGEHKEVRDTCTYT